MAAFYRSNWFPYVLPFLLYLALAQAEEFLPHWHDHLYCARVLICAGLILMWRRHFHAELTQKITARQYFYALLAGTLAFSLWPVAVHENLIHLAQPTASTYPVPVAFLLQGIALAGFVFVFPIMNELFWRSFMLRYFISADFRSVPLGTFQLFSVVGVTILSGLAFRYGLVLGGVSLIMNLLLMWQKNLRCCIVAHSICQILVGTYIMMMHSALF